VVALDKDKNVISIEEKLQQIAEPLRKSGYGEYLIQLMNQ
jgi:hypothetical protein